MASGAGRGTRDGRPERLGPTSGASMFISEPFSEAVEADAKAATAILCAGSAL
jgi:hypothetical protein